MSYEKRRNLASKICDLYRVKIIAAVTPTDDGYGLSYQGRIPWRCDEDLAHFWRSIAGARVLGGRSTLSEIERRLSRFGCKSHLWSVDDLLQLGTDEGPEGRDLWIIGGSHVYEAFLPKAKEIHLTMIKNRGYMVDHYFPVDKIPQMSWSGSLLSDDAILLQGVREMKISKEDFEILVCEEVLDAVEEGSLAEALDIITDNNEVAELGFAVEDLVDLAANLFAAAGNKETFENYLQTCGGVE